MLGLKRWTLVAVLSLAACSSSKSGQNEPAPSKPTSGPAMMGDGGMHGGGMHGGEMHGSMGGGHGAMGAMSEMCPMKVKDTTAKAEDVEGGAAIRFTTTGDTAEVRKRVAAMVAMHTSMHAGGGMGGMAMGDGGMGMAHVAMMAADVKAEDIEGGARVVFTPKDQAKLEALRTEVRDHVALMAGGECPMMSGMAKP